MKFIQVILHLLLILILSCSKNATNTDAEFNISGVVTYNDQPIAGVELSLEQENEVFQISMSNNDGKFEFHNIPSGNYKLNAGKDFADSSFINNTVDLNVSQDIYIDNLMLPEPLTLYEPLEVTWTTVTLCWSSFSPSNFYEYRVYRHISPAIDENTGELVHISTTIHDTTYFDDLMKDGMPARDMTFYYRIYVNNRFGKMSGSNILRVKTNKWENEDNLTVEYELVELENFAGPGGTLTGIDYDGEYFWLLTLINKGGYYDPDSINLLRYNYQTGDVIQSYNYTDEYAETMALAYDGNFLYVGIDANFNEKVIKIDPNTGSKLNSYSINYGLSDLAIYENNIFINYYYNRIEKANVINFGLVEIFDNPFGSGANFGITHRDGEIWLSCKGDNQLAILDENGVHIGVANTSLLSNWNGYDSHLHLCFRNENLVLVKFNRVYILEIQQ
jgi:hypothetical protein